MTGLRPALLALAVLGLIEAGAAAAILATSPDPALSMFEQMSVPVIGVLWIGTGLLAWLRRPDNRTGALMAMAGFAWLLDPLAELWSAPAAVVIGYILGPLYMVAVAHLVLAYPSGRLPSRSLRVLVTVLYLTATLGQLPGLLMAHIASTYKHHDAGSNPLLVHTIKLSSEWPGALVEIAGVVLLALTVRALLRRWRVASQPRRRLLAPLLWPAMGMFAFLAVALVAAVASLPHWVGTAAWVGETICFAAIPISFLAFLLRTQVSGVGAVGDLMAGLQGAPAGASLRDGIAQAMRDPSIELGYWLPEKGSYVDAEGRPFEWPKPDGRRAVAEIEHDGRPVAVIVHDATLLDQPELIQSVGAAAALALENERLDAELRARIEEVRASRVRLISAEEAARRRLERSLHDGPQQRLVALALGMRTARSRLPDHPDTAAELLEACEKELTTTIDELRELARGIHPAVLSDRGLEPALESLCGRFPIPVEIGEFPRERLPAAVESAAYLVISEALANIARYSEASHATVTVARRNGHALVEVRDDGVGGADPSRGNGLRALVDRVGALDGSLELVSAPGEGTIVYAEIPCV
ncbi:MAG TPA: sensor histidine kinase [Thermoleophilaceae bacterium]